MMMKPTTGNRRTTLTLPAEYLEMADRIARERRVNLSVVVSEALGEGLRVRGEQRRTEEILELYKTAFSGFSEEELMVLDGIVLQPE